MERTVNDALAGPGETVRWLKTAPRLLLVCGELFVFEYVFLRLQLGETTWPKALGMSLLIAVFIPVLGLLYLRYQPCKWGNVGMVAGFFATFNLVMAPWGRHAPGSAVVSALAAGAVGAWVIWWQFVYVRRTWLRPLATDLARIPATFDVPLAGKTGTLRIRPDGIQCGAVPGRSTVFAEGADGRASFPWGAIALVEPGEFTAAEETVPAVRILLGRGRQLVLPVEEAEAVAAICAARIGARDIPSLEAPVGWRPTVTLENPR